VLTAKQGVSRSNAEGIKHFLTEQWKDEAEKRTEDLRVTTFTITHGTI
jgi:hypothetical protein